MIPWYFTIYFLAFSSVSPTGEAVQYTVGNLQGVGPEVPIGVCLSCEKTRIVMATACEPGDPLIGECTDPGPTSGNRCPDDCTYRCQSWDDDDRTPDGYRLYALSHGTSPSGTTP
jgi:hypothetical protein